MHMAGGDVWACWPVDGHWYRAKVRGFAPRDRVKVSWCGKEDGHECVPWRYRRRIYK